MGLFLSNSIANVGIPELGITIVNPTIDFEISAQFTSLEIKGATGLTNAIRAGQIQWRQAIAPAPFLSPTDYDADLILADETNEGLGDVNERLVKFKDLNNIARYVAIGGFDGNASVGRWLEFTQNNRSDQVPFIIPETSELRALSVSTRNNSTGTMTIFKNAIALTTISLSGADKNSISALTLPLSVNDELSVQVTAGSFDRPNIYIFLKVA